jgi:hypothetical protein
METLLAYFLERALPNVNLAAYTGSQENHSIVTER